MHSKMIVYSLGILSLGWLTGCSHQRPLQQSPACVLVEQNNVQPGQDCSHTTYAKQPDPLVPNIQPSNRPAEEKPVAPLKKLMLPDLPSAPGIKQSQIILFPQQDQVIIQPKTPEIRFGQADNFKVVAGQLQRWRKTWQLRYAPIDAVDPFGGKIVLQGIADASKLEDGRQVRVSGVLIPPESRHEPARYIVQTIELID